MRSEQVRPEPDLTEEAGAVPALPYHNSVRLYSGSIGGVSVTEADDGDESDYTLDDEDDEAEELLLANMPPPAATPRPCSDPPTPTRKRPLFFETLQQPMVCFVHLVVGTKIIEFIYFFSAVH